MAKRFRDTRLSREAWYRKLKPSFKCAWDFLCDECDEAGMWSIDLDALIFFIGEEIDFNEFVSKVNDGKQRVEFYEGNKVWLTGFVEFQYGQLSETCIPHRKIIILLKKYKLIDRVPGRVGDRVHGTLQEKKGKEEDKEKDNEKTFGKSENLLSETPAESDPPKAARKPTLKIDKDDQTALKAQYAETVAMVQTLPEAKDQKIELAKFIAEHKPKFIEPYCDLWNVSVKPYRVSQVETISDSRIKKFKTRIREPSFDFVKILSEIKISDYLQGKSNDWRVDWDWVFENDTNYLKIIEGKYRNNTN